MKDGPFAWSETTQGLILGAYFWGYIVTQIPGGRIAEMFSAKWVIWGSVMVNVIFTILTPLAAYWSYVAVLFVRVMEGLGAVSSRVYLVCAARFNDFLCQGVSLPAIHVMLSKWALPQERNMISSLAYAGKSSDFQFEIMRYFTSNVRNRNGVGHGYFAAVFRHPRRSIRMGVGVLRAGRSRSGLVPLVGHLRVRLAREPPAHASRREAAVPPIDDLRWPWTCRTLYKFDMICITSLSNNPSLQNLPVPWKALLTSGPFWAILVAHTCNNFGWYMLLVELPSYMKHILRFNVSEVSISC